MPRASGPKGNDAIPRDARQDPDAYQLPRWGGEKFSTGVLHYSERRGRLLTEQAGVPAGPSPRPAAMGSDAFYSCWVSWQDDVKAGSGSEGLPGCKPPPPPPPLAQGHGRPPTQRRKPAQEDVQPPSSASSHSGIVFSAPRTHSPPAGTAPAPGAPAAPDPPSSPIYASVSPANPGSKRPLDAHLALVNQHPIGPFPRVRSPPHLKSPPAEATPAGGCLPPPSPSGRPDTTGTNQHFVMVEVHRPDSEPDVNEVRALPQTRGEYCPPRPGLGCGAPAERARVGGLPAALGWSVRRHKVGASVRPACCSAGVPCSWPGGHQRAPGTGS